MAKSLINFRWGFWGDGEAPPRKLREGVGESEAPPTVPWVLVGLGERYISFSIIILQCPVNMAMSVIS